MKKSFTILIQVLALCLTLASAQKQNFTAASMSMKLGLLKETKEIWANFILNQLSNIMVKDMEFEHGHVLENIFNIFQPPQVQSIYDNTQLDVDHTNNTVKISIKGMRIGFTSQQFKFKGTFIFLKGATQIDISEVVLNTTFKVETQNLADGRKVPALSVADFGIQFPEDYMNILIQGNIETKVSQKFKKVFLDELTNQIEQSLAVALQTRLIPDLNNMITESRGYIEIFPNIMFDYSIQGSPVVEKHYFGVGVTGLFGLRNHTDLTPADLEHGIQDQNVLHPNTPLFDREGAKLQFHLHQMSLNSALFALCREVNVQTWILSDSEPGYQLNLTTSGLNQFFIQNKKKETMPAPAELTPLVYVEEPKPESKTEPKPEPKPESKPNKTIEAAKNATKKNASAAAKSKNATKQVKTQIEQKVKQLIEKPMVKKEVQDKTGFVAKFGAKQPVNIKIDLERVQNLRVHKNNRTMELQTDISFEFWLNNGTLNEVLGLTIKNCLFYFTLNQSDSNSLFTQIQSFDFGEVTVDYSALVNVSELPSNHTNFNMNMVKVHQYIDSIKPVISKNINVFLEKQQFQLPTSLFYGIFEFEHDKITFDYHDSFITINVDPTVRKAKYDDVTEPRLIYQAFNGQNAPELQESNFVFLEELLPNGKVQQQRMRDFSLLESFTNQVQIFGEVPPIQN